MALLRSNGRSGGQRSGPGAPHDARRGIWVEGWACLSLAMLTLGLCGPSGPGRESPVRAFGFKAGHAAGRPPGKRARLKIGPPPPPVKPLGAFYAVFCPFVEELKRLSRTMCLVRLPLLRLIRPPLLHPGNDRYSVFDIPSRNSVSIQLSAGNCLGLPRVYILHIAKSMSTTAIRSFVHSVKRVPHRLASTISACYRIGSRLMRAEFKLLESCHGFGAFRYSNWTARCASGAPRRPSYSDSMYYQANPARSVISCASASSLVTLSCGRADGSPPVGAERPDKEGRLTSAAHPPLRQLEHSFQDTTRASAQLFFDYSGHHCHPGLLPALSNHFQAATLWVPSCTWPPIWPPVQLWVDPSHVCSWGFGSCFSTLACTSYSLSSSLRCFQSPNRNGQSLDLDTSESSAARTSTDCRGYRQAW